MPKRQEYRVTEIPSQPGVYLFRDRLGEVIYVGKAKSLRKRLSSYFQPSRVSRADPKLRSLIHSIAEYELHEVRSDEEALMLESRLIKQYSPRYNVLLRDDKRFLLVKIDLTAPYPRLMLARLRKDDGCTYIGPFPVATAIRDTVDYLTRHFGLRSCRAPVPGETERKHCLDHIVRDCSAPCEGKISREEYHQRVQDLIAILEGKHKPLIEELRERMLKAAEKQRFERAAKLRDVIQNLETVCNARHRRFVHAHVSTGSGGQAGIAQLQEVLSLPADPRTIECFDNSNIMGRFSVASMVCFVDGVPSRKDYRHYRIRQAEGNDDFAMMREVLTRRYRRLLDEGRSLPDLVVVDGGIGQLSAAYDSLLALGLDKLPLISLAKKREEVHTIYDDEPLRLERHDAALRLLQALRDEAHRFAITYNRDLRRQRILDSLLDEIPGVGKKRKQQLLKAFGSVRNLRRFGPEELRRRVPGIGERLAADICEHLRRQAPGESDETGEPDPDDAIESTEATAAAPAPEPLTEDPP